MPDFKEALEDEIRYVTDNNHASIQDALDHVLDPSNRQVIVKYNDRHSFVSTTVHIGYGVGNFDIAQLHGRVGYRPDYGGVQPGSEIQSDGFVDRPVVNIQGGRNSGIKDFSIRGFENLDGNPGSGAPFLTRANPTSYVPTGANTGQRNPFCGVCIDAYSGSTPASPYPTPTYPGFLGAVAGAYGRNFSSACWVVDCSIKDTFIGILVQPNSDNNGDFMNFERNLIQNCAYGVAVTQSQGRNTQIQNCRFSNCHTAITNFGSATHPLGQQIGNFGGNYNNLHLDNGYQVLNVSGWSTPVHLSNLYMEAMMRIGVYTAAQIHFTSCKFEMMSAAPNSGVEADLTEEYEEPVFVGDAIWDTVHFFRRRTVFHFNGQQQFNNCFFEMFGIQPTSNIREAAWGVLAGVINTPDLDHPQGGSRFINCTTKSHYNGFTGNTVIDGYDTGQINTIWSIGQVSIFPQQYDFRRWDQIYTETPSSRSLGGQGTANGRTLTLTWGSIPTYIEPGDVFWEQDLDWWYVDSVSGNNAVCKALTSYRMASGNYTMLQSPASATLFYIPRGQRDFVPTFDRFFRTTSGSPTLEIIDGAGAGAGFPATSMTVTALASKPLWWAQPFSSSLGRFPFPAKTYVTSVTAGPPATLTMSANATVSGVWAYGPGILRIS